MWPLVTNCNCTLLSIHSADDGQLTERAVRHLLFAVCSAHTFFFIEAFSRMFSDRLQCKGHGWNSIQDFHPGECIKIGLDQYQLAGQLHKPHEMKTIHYTQFLGIPCGVENNTTQYRHKCTSITNVCRIEYVTASVIQEVRVAYVHTTLWNSDTSNTFCPKFHFCVQFYPWRLMRIPHCSSVIGLGCVSLSQEGGYTVD